MKKIFTSILLVLAVTNLLGQTVGLNVITVNGQSVNNNVINLGLSTANVSITLATSVTLLSVPSDSNPGTINIYYKKETNLPEIVTAGGAGGNLLFLGSTTANRNFTISLYAPDFNSSGGFIYCEYTTFSGVKYKSPNRAIVKNTIVTPNPPTSSSCENCQVVPYGGYALLPKLLSNYRWYSMLTPPNHSSNDPLYYFISLPLTNSQSIYQKENSASNTTCNNFYIFVTPINDLNCTVTGYENSITYDNSTSTYQYVQQGGFSQTLIGNSANYQCNATNNSPSTTIPISAYQWQKRLISVDPDCSAPVFELSFPTWYVNHSWINIPNATGSNYDPGVVNLPYEYRRLAKVTNCGFSNCGEFSSNVVSIVPLSSARNQQHIICCDQTTPNFVEVANTLTGNEISGITTQYYIWQVSRNSEDWINVKSGYGTSANTYTPERPYFWGYGSNSVASNTFYYRRIIVSYANTFHPSNIISIYFKRSTRGNRYGEIEELDNGANLNVYPNPANNIINIESTKDLNPFNIKIIDIAGRTILMDNKTNSEKIHTKSIDISMLPHGVYSIIFENASDNQKIIKRIIKN